MIIKNIEYDGYTIREKERSSEEAIPYVAGGVLFVILLGWIIFGDHGFYVESGRERD